MAALAVSFDLPFRETLDFALFLKNQNVILSKSSVCKMPFRSVCLLVLPTFLYLYGICEIISQSFCLTVTNEQMYCVWEMWGWLQQCLSSGSAPFFLECASAILSIENYGNDVFKCWKDEVFPMWFFIMCLYDDCIQLCILCLLNICLPF